MDTRPNKDDQRTFARPAAVAAFLLAAVVSACAYVVLSETINGLPSTRQFHGWIALLHRAHTGAGDVPEVQVDANSANGQHPSLYYSVVACGPKPLEGILLLGGDARLTDVRKSLGFDATSARSKASAMQSNVTKITNIKRLAFVLPRAENRKVNLGPVQVVYFSVKPVARCYFDEGKAQPPEYYGEVQSVLGLAEAPVHRLWTFAWLVSPHVAETWPLVGSLPLQHIFVLNNYHVGSDGPFIATGAMSGEFFEFTKQYNEVTGEHLPTSSSLDDSRPRTDDADTLDWTSSSPIRPTVQWTDKTALARWENWLVLTAILLGITTALGGSTLFELTKPFKREDHTEAHSRRRESLSTSPVSTEQQRSKPRWRALAIFVLLFWIARKGKIRRAGHGRLS